MKLRFPAPGMRAHSSLGESRVATADPKRRQAAPPYTEANDLASQPELSPKVAEPTALLEKEMQRSGDTGALKTANPKPAGWIVSRPRSAG